MAQTPKSWQDAFTASFGEESETHGAQAVDRNGLVIGGVYESTPPTIADGEFSRLQTDASGNLMVNLAAGESINVGTLTLGTLNSIGTVANVNAGSIRVVAGTVNAGTIDILKAGTINTGTINAGTVDLMKAGTVDMLKAGTIDVLSAGTVTVTSLSGVVVATGVSIAGTSTPIPASTLANRKTLIAYNVGTNTVYLGGVGVGSASGIPVGTAQYTPAFDLGTTILYGIGDGGSINVLEVS